MAAVAVGPDAEEQIGKWTEELAELSTKITKAEAEGKTTLAAKLDRNINNLNEYINLLRTGTSLPRVRAIQIRRKENQTFKDLADFTESFTFNAIGRDVEAPAAPEAPEAAAAAAAAALPGVLAELSAARRAEPQFMEDEPLFEGFPNKVYSDELLNHIFALSQSYDLQASIQTSKIPDENSDNSYLTIKGFSPIMTFLLLQHLDKENSIFVMPPITILSSSSTYKPGSTPTTLGFQMNNSFIGITNFNKFKNAFNAQTVRQSTFDEHIPYSESQQKMINTYKVRREKEYIDLEDHTNENTKIVDSNSANPYAVKYYRLLSETTRNNIINFIKYMISISKHELKILIIPLMLNPLHYHEKIFGHAQYLIINIKEKKYTIFDGQYSGVNDKEYTNMIKKELDGLDPLITECMGKKFNPYLYDIRCPQSIIKDSNCIWWSLLMVYLYIKSSAYKTNRYTILLNSIIENGSKSPNFLFKLITSFKAFLLETIVLPKLLSGLIDSTPMRVFFRRHFPISNEVFRPYETSDLPYTYYFRKHLPKKNIHGIRNIAAVNALAAKSQTKEGGASEFITMNGRRRKLTSKSRHMRSTRNYGKYTRKSHRRSRY